MKVLSSSYIVTFMMLSRPIFRQTKMLYSVLNSIRKICSKSKKREISASIVCFSKHVLEEDCLRKKDYCWWSCLTSESSIFSFQYYHFKETEWKWVFDSFFCRTAGVEILSIPFLSKTNKYPNWLESVYVK